MVRVLPPVQGNFRGCVHCAVAANPVVRYCWQPRPSWQRYRSNRVHTTLYPVDLPLRLVRLQTSFVGDNGKTLNVQTILIDTVILSGQSYHDEETDVWVKAEAPEDPALADAQWTWLESKLAASTADFLFVGGHYPVWSVCQHGPTSLLVDKLKPLLEKYKATSYLCGHDHFRIFG